MGRNEGAFANSIPQRVPPLSAFPASDGGALSGLGR